MNRMHYQRMNFCILGLAVAMGMSFASFPVSAQDDPAGTGFQFIPGVIITSDRSKAYVMNPEGGIDAVDLSQGSVLWTTKEASKPLGLKNNMLISQAEPSGTSNKLSIVALNVQEGGKREVAGSMELPGDVRVTIDETLQSKFIASAKPLDNDAVVTWDHIEHPIQGIPPGTELPPDDPQMRERGMRAMSETAADSTTSGSLRMDLSSGQISPLPPGTRSFAPAPPEVASVTADDRLSGVPGNQFVSADGRHVLGSERIAGGAEWEQYRWTIFDRSTGERLGELKSHLSVAPFLVADSKVLYQTTPLLRRTQEGLMEEPAKIRAVDLQTGRELWNKDIRDTTFRGPYPP